MLFAKNFLADESCAGGMGKKVMGKTHFTRMVVLFGQALLVGLPGYARAESDLSGEWGGIYHEDFQDRFPGPLMGDFLGMPINDDARLRAESWTASVMTVPEHQCIPHGAPYVMRGPANMAITRDIDQRTQRVTAYRFSIELLHYRVVHLDGRPHPGAKERHTWQGFSTGRWERNTLVVDTTHLKSNELRRNGIPYSDKTTLREYFTRYGDYLTQVAIVRDPVYLTEPYIRSTNWILTLGNRILPGPCQIAEEIDRPEGEIPHFFPGENTEWLEFGSRFNLPTSVTRGGARSMYPEFQLTLPARESDPGRRPTASAPGLAGAEAASGNPGSVPAKR